MSHWAYGLYEYNGELRIGELYFVGKKKVNAVGACYITKKEFIKNHKVIMKDIRSQLKNWKIPVIKGEPKHDECEICEG